MDPQRVRRDLAATARVLMAALALVGPATGAHAAASRRVIDLGAGGYGTIRLAGRTVRDLAVADRLLVGVQRGVTTAASARASISKLGGTVSRTLGNGQVLVVDLQEGSDVVSAAGRLVGQAGVRFAEPDRLVYPTVVPSDPEYSNQWHLPKVQCPLAWSLSTGSPSVVIAFVDSGIDLAQPDLVDRVWTNADEIAGNGKDDDGNGYVDDVHGWNFVDGNANVQAIPDGADEDGYGGADDQVNHGTLTAGTAAASQNGWGCVGVSWSSTVMPLKVFPDDGSTSLSVVVEAMYYAVRNGADIMNLSLGSGYSETFTPPIVELWDRGGLTVSAAGNDGDQITDARSTWVSPTCNNGTLPLIDNMNLGVGAVDSSDRKASWSNYDASTNRSFVEVFAPGVAIHGPAVYYPTVSGFSSYFQSNSGTSFSAPMVAGLAALLKAQDPSRTGSDLIQLITSTCDSIDAVNPGYTGKMGAGRIDAARALGVDVPPAAVSGLGASDTPDDQGGSITLTWTQSSDDGSGSDEVTGYTVSRAEGALPSAASARATWTDLATLDRGTKVYVDGTTTDGVPYYYRVATVADGHRVESDAVGPAVSVDDSAPPRVTDLSAVDHAGDSGGSIDLSWPGYAATTDLAGFDVYREGRAFTTITGRTPLATVANSSARAYRDSASVDGADYYYAVVPYDALGNRRPDVLTAGPVQSYSNSAVQFAAGLQMLAAPVIPPDAHPATLFGIAKSALRYARWSPALGDHLVYSADPLPEALELALGRGFWISLPETTTVAPAGNVAPAGDFDVALVAGWQQVGNPYLAPVDYSASSVTVGGTTMDLLSADAAGVVRSYAWVYNAATQDYDLVHPIYGATTLVAPWRGFWVQADRACTLTLVRPTGSSAARSSAARPAAGTTDWPVRITAQGRTATDSANFFGVASAGNGIVSPPMATGGIDLSFEGAPGFPSTVRTATALYPTATSGMAWTLDVTWTTAQGRIVLRWPDLSMVPSQYGLVMRDPATGQAVSMRHRTSYSFDASAVSGSRSFVIQATQAHSGVVQVSAMAVQQVGSGAQIAFSLTAPAQCDVTVLNMAGRPVRALAVGKLMASGASTVAWDGRGTGGSRAPAGAYLVRVTARTDDGAASSALRNLHLSR
jgi:subtilisin family serine protease